MPTLLKRDPDLKNSLGNGHHSNTQSSCEEAREDQRRRFENLVEPLGLGLGLRDPVSVDDARVKAALTIEGFDKDFSRIASSRQQIQALVSLVGGCGGRKLLESAEGDVEAQTRVENMP